MAESNKLPTSKKLSSHFNNPAWNKVHRIFLPHNKKNPKKPSKQKSWKKRWTYRHWRKFLEQPATGKKQVPM